MFNSRDELDDALQGFVEPSESQILEVDRALAKEGIFFSRESVELTIKGACVAQEETTSSVLWRTPRWYDK